MLRLQTLAHRLPLLALLVAARDRKHPTLTRGARHVPLNASISFRLLFRAPITYIGTEKGVPESTTPLCFQLVTAFPGG